MAQEAVEALQPHGKTIADAVAHYVAHLTANEKSCTAKELVDELVEAKERDGLSARHVSDLRCRLKMFATKFEREPVATITGAAIDDWLRSLPVSAVTRNHLSTFDYSGIQFRRETRLRREQSSGEH
jgi:hypothetical protein